MKLSAYLLLILALSSCKEDSKENPQPWLHQQSQIQLSSEIEAIEIFDSLISVTSPSENLLVDFDQQLSFTGDINGFNQEDTVTISLNNQVLTLMNHKNASAELIPLENQQILTYDGNKYSVMLATTSQQLWNESKIVYTYLRSQGLSVASVDNQGKITPTLSLDTHDLQPQDLQIHNDRLLLLDFERGLIVYDISQPTQLNEINRVTIGRYSQSLTILNDRQIVIYNSKSGLHLLDGFQNYQQTSSLLPKGPILGLTTFQGNLVGIEKTFSDKTHIKEWYHQSENLRPSRSISVDGHLSSIASNDSLRVIIVGDSDGVLTMYSHPKGGQ